MAALRGLRVRYQRFEFLGNLIFALLSVVAIYIAMGRAAFSIVAGKLTVGDLAIYGSGAAQLRGLVEGSVALIAGLRWDLLHIGNLRAFLSLPCETPGHAAALRIPLSGGIAFRDVALTYPGSTTPTLSPTEGAVLFDGVDARKIDVDDVRRQVTCLFQQFGRYSASVADNIAFGDWERLRNDEARIREIARTAGVDEMIDAVPGGYQTTPTGGASRLGGRRLPWFVRPQHLALPEGSALDMLVQ